MSYTMEVLNQGGYLHFKVKGEQSPKNMSDYFHEIYLTCIERRCPVVLIEENLRGPGLAVMDIFEVVVKGSKETWPHVRKIAYVDVNPVHSFTDLQFAETVAVNRGVNVKIFKTLPEAETWIKTPDDLEQPPNSLSE